jgi:hypothetical protein
MAAMHRHPALREELVLGPDIYEPLFGWFFKTEEFANWLRDGFDWQLRCDGSPGSGKVSLASSLQGPTGSLRK